MSDRKVIEEESDSALILISLIAFFSIFCLIPMASAFLDINYSSSENVSSCRELNKSNTEYLLESDIEDCTISIKAPNLTFDCQNHLLNGLNRTEPAIEIIDLHYNNNITVKNCYIENYTGVAASFGTLDIENTSNVILDNLSLRRSNLGVKSRNTTNVSLNDIEVNEGSWHNIYFVDSSNCSVRNSEVRDTGWQGVYLKDSDNCTISDIIANFTRNGVYLENSDYNDIARIYSRNSSYDSVDLTKGLMKAMMRARNTDTDFPNTGGS